MESYIYIFNIYISIYTYFKNYQTECGHKIPIHLKNRDFNPEFSAFSCQTMFLGYFFWNHETFVPMKS